MENRGVFNSPVIQKNTPIKRLGLSRKRKSSGCGGLNTGQGSNEKSRRLELKNKGLNDSDLDHDSSVDELNYEKELQALKARISEKEEKLKTLQKDNKNIVELEELIEVWRAGCKNAFLEFVQVIQDREPNIKARDVLHKLGIWETVLKHFEHDCDFSEGSQ